MFNLKEGWEPLCNFLGVPVPKTPFPCVNERAEFQRRQAVAGWRALAILTGMFNMSLSRVGVRETVSCLCLFKNKLNASVLRPFVWMCVHVYVQLAQQLLAWVFTWVCVIFAPQLRRRTDPAPFPSYVLFVSSVYFSPYSSTQVRFKFDFPFCVFSISPLLAL